MWVSLEKLEEMSVGEFDLKVQKVAVLHGIGVKVTEKWVKKIN